VECNSPFGVLPLIFWITYLGQIVDTVVMNPPFGTRKKGADMDFLFVALKVNMGNNLLSLMF
jgi:predicted RNA methylase